MQSLKNVDSDGLVIVKLKHKLEYRGHVLFEVVRSDFLRIVLTYLKKNNYFYKDIIVRNDLEEVITQVESKVNGIERHLFEEINEEALSLLDLTTNIGAFIHIVLENMP